MKEIEKEIEKYIVMIEEHDNQDIIEEIIISLQFYFSKLQKEKTL